MKFRVPGNPITSGWILPKFSKLLSIWPHCCSVEGVGHRKKILLEGSLGSALAFPQKPWKNLIWNLFKVEFIFPQKISIPGKGVDETTYLYTGWLIDLVTNQQLTNWRVDESTAYYSGWPTDGWLIDGLPIDGWRIDVVSNKTTTCSFIFWTGCI